ncbi:hypothetical protein HRbin11_01914 [bacterium HR11]|nr:hypothetical protein HRbin11_01914 [bacterium HR11]
MPMEAFVAVAALLGASIALQLYLAAHGVQPGTTS